MATGFDTNDPTVLASLDNILALAEAGDESAWTRLADLWAGRFGVGGLSRHDLMSIAVAALRAFNVAREFYKHRDLAGAGFGEDPRAIVRDAMDPSVPASDVRIRARLRSRTGRLVAAVEQKLAERPTFGGVPL